jgi:hypothetical protein
MKPSELSGRIRSGQAISIIRVLRADFELLFVGSGLCRALLYCLATSSVSIANLMK